MSTACDFRVMSQSAKIGFVQLRMGVTTGWGGATRMVNLLGRQKSLAILSSAKVMTAEEAHKVGLADFLLSALSTSASSTLESSSESGSGSITALVPDSSLEEMMECKKWLIENYCRHDAQLIQANKSVVVNCEVTSNDLEASLAFERDVFAKHWGGPIQRAALEAKIKHK